MVRHRIANPTFRKGRVGSTPTLSAKQWVSLMVKQRIYIPCATDNWPIWVRVPYPLPVAPMDKLVKSSLSKGEVVLSSNLSRGTINIGRVA